MTKGCPRCQTIKPLTEFALRNSHLNKRQSYCRACCNKLRRIQYERDKASGKARRYQEQAYALCRKIIHEAKDRPCVDCGQRFHFAAMDFDHLPHYSKRANISWLVGCGMVSALKIELRKCDVVCANCHRVRTYNRMHGMSSNR